MFSCNKELNREVPSDTSTKLPTDPELVNTYMDNLSKEKARLFKGKPPHPPKGGNGNNNGGDTLNPPTPPPPTDLMRGCFLIDFDGHDEQGVFGTFHVNGSGLSATAQAAILAAVQQNYSVFSGIEVTTDEARFNLYPQNMRRRCAVTTTNWYGNVGGVAFIGSFKWFDNTSCFVFSSLLQYNARYISDAVTHEFGHTINLRHQSTWELIDGVWTKTSEYHWGTSAEAPFMGGSYYAQVPKWWTGYNSVFVWQDDVAVANNTFNQ
jgi:hypothetical protein